MTDVVMITSPSSGSAAQGKVRTALVYDGRRGPQGTTGEEGPQGPAGDSVNVKGTWVSGTQYCPNDGVEWRSSGTAGAQSLFVQYESQPCSLSTTEPHLDPGRWLEVGIVDPDALGNIYLVEQPAHGWGTTHIGMPMFFNRATGVWGMAVATSVDTLSDAVFREVVDQDRFLVQFSGVVPSVAPEVLAEHPAEALERGIVYALADTSGKVTRTENATGLLQRILKPLSNDSNPDCIVFPAEDGSPVAPVTPAPTPATTVIRLDTITAWNGVITTLPLTSQAAPVPFAPSQSFLIYIDGNRQDPQVDFTIINNGGNADIQFASAPDDLVEMTGVYVAG